MNTIDDADATHARQEVPPGIDAIYREIEEHADRLAAIQKAILPLRLPTRPGFEAAVSHQPRQVVGGDWFAVVPHAHPGEMAARSLGIALGDVCGHDVSATVVMATVLAILHCYPQHPTSPADVMRHLNEHLYRMGLPNGYTTAFLGALSLDTLKLTYCSAGHPQPLILYPDGAVRVLDGPGGYPLGMFEEANCRDAEVTLTPGSLLCLYTDGITDTLSEDGEPYGLDALARSLAGAESSAQTVVDRVSAAVREHQGQAPQRDDRALLVVRVCDLPRG